MLTLYHTDVSNARWCAAYIPTPKGGGFTPPLDKTVIQAFQYFSKPFSRLVPNPVHSLSPFGLLWLIFWRSGSALYPAHSRRPAAAGYIIFPITSQTELQHRFMPLTSLFGCCLTNHRRVLTQTRRSYLAGRRVWPATLLQRCLGRCIRFCYCTRRIGLGGRLL